MHAGEKLAKDVLCYIMEGIEVDTADKAIFLEKVEQHLSPTLKAEAMTLAEQFRAEGFQQGMQQGLHTGEVLVLTRLLTRSFQAIPTLYQQRIEMADGETLLRWSERVLKAKKIEDVFI